VAAGADAGGGGLLVVADAASNLVRGVSLATRAVSTLAGGGSAGATLAGYADGFGVLALFAQPSYVAADAQGIVFVSDAGNNLIRQIILATGYVTTLAGGGSDGGTSAGLADGVGSAALFSAPQQLALSPSAATLYVADLGNHMVRVVDIASGAVSSLAGGGTAGGAPGYTNGAGSAALFSYPCGLALDATGAFLVVSELYRHLLRRIAINGRVVTTLAGGGAAGFTDGVGSAASFNGPVALAIDAANNVYVADSANNAVRLISLASGGTRTLAGGGAAAPGFADGLGAGSLFSGPAGLALDPASTTLFVADGLNNAVRQVGAVPTASVSASATSSLTTSPTPSSLAVSRPASQSGSPSASASASPLLSRSASGTPTATQTATATSSAACCTVTTPAAGMALGGPDIAAGQQWTVSGGPGYMLVQLAAVGSGALSCCMGCGPCGGASSCWGCGVAGGSSPQTNSYFGISAGSVVMAVGGTQAVTLMGSCLCPGGSTLSLVQATSLPTQSTTPTASGTLSPTSSGSPSLAASRSASPTATGSLTASPCPSSLPSASASATPSLRPSRSGSASARASRSSAPTPSATSTASTSLTVSATP